MKKFSSGNYNNYNNGFNNNNSNNPHNSNGQNGAGGLNGFLKNNRDIYENYAKNNPQNVAELNQMLNNFSGMNQDAIFNELMRVAQEKKRNGTLSLAYIENLRSVLFPHLTSQQKQIFENLLNSIR